MSDEREHPDQAGVEPVVESTTCLSCKHGGTSPYVYCERWRMTTYSFNSCDEWQAKANSNLKDESSPSVD